jgi:hypothetical protein
MRLVYIFLVIFNLEVFANNLVEIVLPNDQWKLIGVPGAFMEGSGTEDISTGDDWYFGVRKDANLTGDDEGNFTAIIEDGTTKVFSSSTSTDLAGFRTRNSNGTSYKSVTVSFNASGFSKDIYLPIRKMYIDSDGDNLADTNITYQSDLEGEIFHLKTISTTNEENNYYGYLNSSYGENNPFQPTLLTGTSSTYSFEIREIIDMDLTNNPGKDGKSGNLLDYRETSHRDDLDINDWIKVFRLDSTNSRWESFNSLISDTHNDFTTLSSGNSYWVKLHDDAEATKKHGLILGDDNISFDTYSSDYKPLSSTLKTSRNDAHRIFGDGWNMLSFPDGNIRHSGTGLRLTTSSAGDGDQFKIADEVEKESFFITIFDIDGSGAVSTEEISRSINNGIAGAVEDGNLSKNFNVRAFPNGATGVMIIADKRFRIYDIDQSGNEDNIFGAVITIGEQNPYNLSTNSYSTVSPITTTGAMSRYGEYAIVATINNDGAGNTAGSMNSANQQLGKVQINGNVEIDMSDSNTITNLDDNIQGDVDIDVTKPIDLDIDGNNDSMIIVNTSSPFYIRDHTFTKVYRLDDNHSLQNGDPDIYFDKTGSDTSLSTISLDNGNFASDIVTDLGALNPDLESKDDGDYIYITTVNKTYKDFDLKEFGDDDIFSRVVSNNPLALGTITKVYSLDQLARADVNKSIYSVQITADAVNVDTTKIEIDNVETTFTNINGDYAGKVCYNLKTQINSLNINVYADCNTSDIDSDQNTTALLTISGYFSKAGALTTTNNRVDLKTDTSADSAYNYNLTDWDSVSVGGTLQNIETLTDDLRYFPVYTPDFATSDGVLPYIRENGFEAKSILTAVDNGSGSISWKYLDLTTNTSDWFSDLYNFDLFSIEKERGYFVNLSEKGATNLTLTPTLSLNFYQHYNNDNNITGLTTAGNVDNFFKGTLSARLSNDEGDNSQVIATIQNREYPLLKSGDYYSLDLSRDNFPYLAMSDSNITLTAYDEKGNIESEQIEFNLSSPAKPIVQFFNGKIAFVGTTSSDLRAFNIYSGRIDDRYATHPSNSAFIRNLNPENDYKTNDIAYYSDNSSELTGKILLNSSDYNTTNSGSIINYNSDDIGNVTKASNPTYYFMSYNICEDAPDFDTNNSGWRIVSVDGDGDAENSRVSNITFIDDWYAIYKNASVLRVGKDIRTADNKPALYGTDCLFDGNRTIDNGVILTDVDETTCTTSCRDAITTIAYDTISTGSVTTGIPAEVVLCYQSQVDNGSEKNISKIQFDANKYVSTINTGLSSPKTLLVDVNNTYMFKTTFDKLYAFDIANNTGCFDLNSTDGNSSQLDISNGQKIIKSIY